MNPKTSPFWFAIGFFATLLLMWASHLIPSLLVVLGLFALVAMVICIKQITSPWLRAISALLYLGWILIFVVAPMLYHVFPSTKHGISDAMTLKDVWGGEKFHPPAGMALSQLQQYCNTVEIMAIEEITKKNMLGVTQKDVKDAINRINGKTETTFSPAEDNEMRARITALKNWRIGCSDYIIRNTPKSFVSKTTDHLKGMRTVGWVVFILGLILGGRILDAATGQKWISHLTTASAVLCIAYLFGDYLSKVPNLSETLNPFLINNLWARQFWFWTGGVMMEIITLISAVKQGKNPIFRMIVVFLGLIFLHAMIFGGIVEIPSVDVRYQ